MNTPKKSLIIKLDPEERLKILANLIIDRIIEEQLRRSILIKSKSNK